MPLDADQIWRKEDILTGTELKAIIEDEYGPLVPITSGDPSETGRAIPLVMASAKSVSSTPSVSRSVLRATVSA